MTQRTLFDFMPGGGNSAVASSSTTTPVPAVDEEENCEFDPNDFGRAVVKGKAGATSEEKEHWLRKENVWMPPESFNFPTKNRTSRGTTEVRLLKQRDLQREESEWISYSHLKKGLYCRACFFFSNVRGIQFVDMPFVNYARLWGKESGITHHVGRGYHTDAVDRALAFLQPEKHIDTNMNSAAKRKFEAGKGTVNPKIEIAIFLAKLGLPFRGHREGKDVQPIESMDQFKGDEGCFRAMVQFGAFKNVDDGKALKKVQLCEPDVIFATVLLARAMLVLKGLSELLQKEDADLLVACEEVKLAIELFGEWRCTDTLEADVTGSYPSVCRDAGKLHSDCVKRKHEMYGSHFAMEVEEPDFTMFRQPVYTAFIDSLMESLSVRFGPHFRLVASMSNLLPHRVVSTSYADVQPVIQFYMDANVITCTTDEVRAQFDTWKKRCQQMSDEERQGGFKTALSLCRRESTTLVRKLLLVYVTLPLSSACAERSFSGLKRIKNWLRSTSTTERTDGLLVVHMNKDIPVTVEAVRTEFDSKKHRRYMPPAKKARSEARQAESQSEESSDESSASDNEFISISDSSDEE